MTTTLGAPDDIKTSHMSVQLSSLREVIRPKDLSPDVFTPLMEQWLKRKQPLPPRALGEDRSIPRAPRPKPDKESADKYSQVENGLMSLLPIKEEQLAKIPSLLPDLTSKFKPTTMSESFGWVIGLAEIEQLGRMKGEYMTTRPILHCYEPGDPDCPEDAEFEDGVWEVLGEEVFSPIWTASRLLRRAKKELGLDDKYTYTGRCPYFRVNGITAKFDGAKDTMFVSIYTNLDLLPQQQAEAPLPTRDDIERMQEWLGLKGDHREPGWWFSLVGLVKTTWRQYWIEGDM